MWIRIKGQLYNLAHAITVDCNLRHQFIMICFGSAGVVRGVDQHFHVHQNSIFIDFSEKEGDKIDDCYTNYLRILSLLNLPEDDYDDFKREKMAD